MTVLADRSVGVMSRSYRGCRASGAKLQTLARRSGRRNRARAICQSPEHPDGT